MAEKNRFSKLLKHLMSVAEVKNYTLAQELQYDVSYISKWTSGQMIPSEKYEKKIGEYNLEKTLICKFCNFSNSAGDGAR